MGATAMTLAPTMATPVVRYGRSASCIWFLQDVAVMCSTQESMPQISSNSQVLRVDRHRWYLRSQ